MQKNIIEKGIDSLIPYARNARKHSPQQISKIAASIEEFGFTNPVLIDAKDGIIAGHGRIEAARLLKLKTVPTICLDHLSKTQKKAYILADNRLAEFGASWDDELLNLELAELVESEFDLDIIGFEDYEPIEEEVAGLTDEDAVPQLVEQPVTVLGDVWLLGEHRLLCGDSTVITDVDKLMDGHKAHLLHADPPYGMGKEKDGVLNDNLYKEKLDQFQMDWWNTFRGKLENNASVYIWGKAPDLWRLWYRSGLSDSERITFRNEIVWLKIYNEKGTPDAMGQGSDYRSYAIATERCLFFMLGEQGFNDNADNYWEGFEPIRKQLETERKKAGWDIPTMKTIAGHSDKNRDHWTGKSQWGFLTEEVYVKFQHHCKENKIEAFKKDYKELKKEFISLQAYFDNTHDNMTDVWPYKRVTGEDRHNHATPKPVDMMCRVIKSSLPDGGLCIEPFGGSGSTLIACEKTNRHCFMMELSPNYCDTIINRWQDFTGKQAILEENNTTFQEMKSQR